MELDWNAIGAIGEILGAFFVVVTLIYLAIQIRQNARAVEVSALRDTTANWNHWSELVATSPGLAEIVARGNRSYKGLPEADALRYGGYAQMFFDNTESYLTLVRVHKVEKDIDVLDEIVRRRLAAPGMTEWWDENRTDYDKDFVSWIEKLRPGDE